MPLPQTGIFGRKRRILFIEKAFQLRFIVKMTAVVVFGTVLTGGLLYLLADREFGRAFYSAHYGARSSWELLLPAVLVASFVSMCIVAGVAVVLTLLDSHRIGGPLYRFRANLEAIGDGDLTLVTRLREGDELRPMTEAMNEMTRKLRDQVRGLRAAEGEVRVSLAELRGQVEGGGVPQLSQLEQVQGAADRLRAGLERFRVDG